MRPIRVRAAAASAAVLLSLPLGLLLVTAAGARETGVSIGPGLVFSPKDKFIEVGDTVVWTHRDGSTPHTVESQSSEQFDSSDNCPANPLPPDDCMTQSGRSTFNHTFNSPGNFAYRCELHEAQGMTGVIHVRARSTATPTPTATQTRTVRPTSTSTALATPTGTATGTASPAQSGLTPLPTDSSIVAAPTDGPDDKSNSAAVRGAIAALSIVVLGGVGYMVWRRFIAA